MIECKNGLFHLRNHALSCLLRVNRYGLLEQVHFGAPVRSEDVDALAAQPGLGWGSSLLLNDKDPGSCPDAMALAWSGSGRGDFRESPLEMDGTSTDFCYVNHKVLNEAPSMESGLPQTHGKGETLELTLEQPGARLKLYFTLYETALTRFAVLENTGDTPIALHKLMSFSMDLYGSFTMTTFNGGWAAEMQRCDTKVGASRVVNESATGASSNQHNPGFLLSEADATEDAGRVYGFNLLYSGNHYASARCSAQGFTRVMQGINPANFCACIQPGEKFEPPEAVISYSGAGLTVFPAGCTNL